MEPVVNEHAKACAQPGLESELAKFQENLNFQRENYERLVNARVKLSGPVPEKSSQQENIEEPNNLLDMFRQLNSNFQNMNTRTSEVISELNESI